MNAVQARVGDLIEDGILEIGDGYRVTLKELGDSGFPFVRAADLFDGRIHFEGLQCVPRELYDRVESKLSQPGDVVMTTKGTVGRVAVVGNDDPQCVYSPQLSFWRVKDSSVMVARFLRYWLQSSEFRRQMGMYKGQTSMADYLSLTDQKRVQISLPPFAVQGCIAGILGALDDKIEVNRRINRTLEEMAQTLYKHWFVDFGPFQAGEFVDTELGDVPAGWEVVSIHSLADYVNGGAFPQRILSSDPNAGLPVIKISELNSGGITNSTMYFGEDYKPKYELNTGDVLFAWSASLGIYLWANSKALLNQHIFNVRPTGRVSKETMYFMLKHFIDEFIAIAAARATTMGHITKGHLKEKRVAIPPEDVLAEFDTLIKPIFDQILNSKIENRVLAETRDYLLPNLLSGEVEVPAAEAVVEGRPAGSEVVGYVQPALL